MSDPRKDFICQTLASVIGGSEDREEYLQFFGQDGNGAIAKFMDSAGVNVLSVSVGAEHQLVLANTSDYPPNCSYQVVFAKLKPGALERADIPAGVAVTTVAFSPLSSLYHSLHDVFTPMLVSGKAGDKSSVSSRLQELMQQLEAGLGTAVRSTTQAAPAQVVEPTSAPLHEILTPLDEINYWADLAASELGYGPLGKGISLVRDSMESLRQQCNELAEGSVEDMEAVKEMIDLVCTALREVWRVKAGNNWAYTQKRATHFMKVVGAAIVGYVQKSLKDVQLWTAPFATLKVPLETATQLLGQWLVDANGVTQDWLMGLDTDGHNWEGEPFKDMAVMAFSQRLDEILAMRETYDELAKLLGKGEAAMLEAQHVFAPFASLSPLQVSEFTEASWGAAKQEYERKMSPIEERISQKLREMFGTVFIPSLTAAVVQRGDKQGSLLAHPQQVFQQLVRYRGLLSRPVISRALQSEKDNLAKQVDKLLEYMQSEFDQQRNEARAATEAASNDEDDMPSGVAEGISWTVATQLKLSSMMEALKALMGKDAQEGSQVLSNSMAIAQDLSKELEAFKKEQFEAWQVRIRDRLNDMAQWKHGKLMSVDAHNSHVRTHFNDSLVSLLREVRQLQSLGFAIRKDICAEVDVANKFYRYGMMLKQRANFYNNIATEMIPSQKPMLLQDAIDFEKVLMNPRDAQGKEITWRSAAALDGYIRRLSGVADNLAEKNRQLRKWHQVLADKVVTLMGTDLVRYKDKWAQGVKEMRDIFSRLEANGFSRDSQQVWRQHWDYQLYKALEYQYEQGVEAINKNLPEIEVKMVFKQHKLQYDPPLEELRIKHYKEYINTFLGLPLKMKGVSDLSERPGFFRPIADANPAGIAHVYSSVEGLFTRLNDELKQYQDWVVLGTVDIDEFADANLEEVPDWELNFKMLKGASKEAEKLPNEVKVDCYKVSLLTVKASIDEHMKKLQEALIASLRRKVVAEKEAVEEYMKRGVDTLGIEANSVEEIGAARERAKQLVQEMHAMQQMRRRIEEKNKLLRQMAGGGKDATFAVVDMSEVNNKWEGFFGQLQKFDAHLEEQKVQLQAQIVKQVEEFKSQVIGFNSRWSELKPKGAPSGDPSVVLIKIEEYSMAAEELKAQADQFNREAEAFKLDPPDLTVLDEVVADIGQTMQAWSRYGDFLKERDELAHRDWLSFRDQIWKIEDFLTKWTKDTEGGKAAAKGDTVALILLKEIDMYRKALPYLKLVKGVGWEDTHWAQLFGWLNIKTTGPQAVSKDNVTLLHFLEKAELIIKHADDIKKLDAQAQGESVLRKALSELKLWSLQREFMLTENMTEWGGKQRKTALIKEWRDVLTEVGDNQSLVASLKQSPYHAQFKDEVLSWESKLVWLQDGLGQLQQVQRKWLYLQPIFARGALPNFQSRFKAIDEDFRRIMGQLEADKKVVAFADIPDIQNRLPNMQTNLDACQRALSDFLEEKRSSFPRFYFIGDDDLLEILGQSKNPEVIQAHLKKLFAGIHKVTFGAENKTIVKMNSIDGESVKMTQPVPVTDAIEGWLNQLAHEMKSTLASQLAVMMAGKGESEASQIMCLHDAIHFTQNVEKALPSGGIKAFQGEVNRQLISYANNDFTGQALLKIKQQALVLDYIHYRDIVDYLVSSGTTNTTDWAWTRQLRFYFKPDGRCQVRMAEGNFDYSWEYQGNAPKLVYTPLTDKCYLTLTQGMALGYGGNPYGPAGTGKTESVKALGQAFARQVLVFNCDEQFDFRSMGRIFVGLVKCGAWGCFDEFNRLDEEVLSAVSQQIQIIQGALKEGAKSMEFMEKTIEVDKNAGIFVTMNPAGKGYGGRSKLPDNLKQLFRSVAMAVPDNDLIAEVLLLAEGFNNARDLGRKTVSLFTLSRELLSPQQHYDWGLRAVKTCLASAGKELRQVRETAGGGNKTLSEQEEAEIIIRAVCSTKMPTFTTDDTRRFTALLGDLFPGISITDAQNAQLQEAIGKVAAEMKLELTKQQIDKIIQLHLACEQRIGIIIVGPSGSGKSLLWQVLDRAYQKLNRKPIVYKMNPKAMQRQQLLGSMNVDTREFMDGVLTAAARKVVKEPLEQRSWIVCDGDVDPEWIESLNSVLDDNKLLTMPNGERIQFANNINFIFECHSLEFASPATVSRCGMIFMSDDQMELDRFIKHWLVENNVADSAAQTGWFDDIFPKAFEWALENPMAVETTKIGLLHSAMSHMRELADKRDFAVGLARGLGANMMDETRVNFLGEMSRWTGEQGLMDAPDSDPLALLGEMVSDAPDDGLVMTESTRGVMAILAPWFKNKEPFIVVGPEGCGKSALLEHCFKRLSGVQVATVSCSAQTSAANVIQKLVQVCGKPVTTNQGKMLRPGHGHLILYLKDLNLPKPDKYRTIQLVAFLQQLLTFNGYYDENLEFINLQRVQIIGSMNPASTVGRNQLTTRFTARVRIAYMTYPTGEELQQIYSKMIQRELSQSEDTSYASAQNAGALAHAMLDVYQQLSETFSQNDNWHYQWTPRDLSAWVQGLRRYNLSGMQLLEAVAHEGARIFRDRLVGVEAAATFDRILVDNLRKLGFKGEISDILCSTLGATTEDRLSGDSSRVKLVRWDKGDYAELVAEKLKQFEREVKDLNLLLFPEVLDRIARFDRVLAQPSGSLLLCGGTGTGRRSLVNLVAYIHNLELFTPKMGINYDVKNFRNDLKDVMRKAGIEGKPVCLFLEDHQLVDGSFLEFVNSLLSGGEVPGLFTAEELTKELGALEQKKQNDNNYQGPDNLFAYFTHLIRRNMHIVVSMDPTNEMFRQRTESNPALFTRCSIQWIEAWSRKALETVVAMKLKNQMRGADEEALLEFFVTIHENMGDNATPRQFFTFIDNYARLGGNRQQQLVEQQTFLSSGLSKLADAAKTVAELTTKAEKSRKLLKAKTAEAEEALTRIQASITISAERKSEVERLRKKTTEEEVTANERRSVVEVELSEVQPLIDQAKKAVGNIKSENLTEIRSLKMPPDPIRDVLEGVLCLMGVEDSSWNNMKKFLGYRDVKEQIMNYDVRKVTPEIRHRVEKLLAAKGANFEQERIYRASVAAAPMAAWVRANVAFAKVLEKVGPLERELSGLQSSLDKSKQLIEQYQVELTELEGQVVTLKDEFKLKTGEAETLKFNLDREEVILSRAKQLLDGLSSEKVRWENEVNRLGTDLAELPRNTLLTAAFITYLPGEPEDERAERQNQWQKMLGLEGFNLQRFMSSESEMLTWKGEGLPSDELSMQNGIVILNASVSPLIIDPSVQAATWLKEHLKGVTLDVTAIQDTKFTTTLELAVRFGKTLIIHEVDAIPGILYPLLRKDMERQGRAVIAIGDKLIDYNESFQLYLVTRNPTPYLPPDAKSLVTVTNFTVTRSGLEGQLLGLTIQKEQPELEAQKSSLLQTEEKFKVELAKLEKTLLQSLATSKGNILENQELLDSLNETKAKSTTIEKSLAESHSLQISLDQQRNVYRPIAQKGSTMFFLIRDLKSVNHMYQFSLSMFLSLFKRSLNRETPPGDVASRISILGDTLLESVINTVSRSLFNLDRLTFGMHMARHLNGALFKPEEWDFFLGRGVIETASGQKPSWVREEQASAYSTLAGQFPAMITACELSDSNLWAPWASSTSPDPALPAKIAPRVGAFQGLLLVKSFRPDRLQTAMTSFITTALNIKSITPSPLSLKNLVEKESSANEPVLFITTPGADPSQELREYAVTAGGRGEQRFHEVAMGQGQATTALQLLKDCAKSGDWLVLKNLHLVVSWLPTLEKEVYALQKHPEFRLFLTSEPHGKFPASLLEACLKITFEAPPGLKKNLQRTYDAWSPDYIRQGSPVRAQLLFVLAWFHAIVQERRTYIPQGWTKFYEFSFADLRSAADIINLAVKDTKAPQWQYLHGLMEMAIYGGRLENNYDVLILRTYLQQYFSPQVLGVSGQKPQPLPGTRFLLPTNNNHQDYMSIINQMGEVDPPALFGLPANIERSVQQVNSQRVIGQLKQMAISQSAAGGFDRKQWATQLNPLIRMWEAMIAKNPNLKQQMDPLRASQEGIHPVTNFVALERAHGRSLVYLIDKTLMALSRVLKGQDTLTTSVQRSGIALLGDEIPQAWDVVWEGPAAPMDYCRAVLMRAASIEQWAQKVQSGNLLQGTLELSSLFHPGTFLNALRQATARELKCSMDNLKLATSWDASKLSSPVLATVGGLLLQGASFDGQRLTALEQDAPIVKAVPPMVLAWILKDRNLPYSRHLTTPLYATTERTKILVEVQMPLGDDSEVAKWTLAAVALFSSE